MTHKGIKPSKIVMALIFCINTGIPLSRITDLVPLYNGLLIEEAHPGGFFK